MLFSRYFRPEIDKITDINGIAIFTTITGVRGFGYQIPLIDLESNDSQDRLLTLERFLYQSNTSLTFRLRQEVARRYDLDAEFSRGRAISTIGRIEKRLVLFIESKAPEFEKDISRLIDQLTPLKGRPLSRAETEIYFKSQSDSVRQGMGLEAGDTLAGVIRLRMPGNESITLRHLSGVLDGIPPPFEVTVTLKPIPGEKSEFILRSKLNRTSFSNDFTSGSKRDAVESAIEAITNFGDQVCEFEWLFTASRAGEEELRRCLKVAASKLCSIFDPYIETIGVRPSYFSSLPGSLMGLPLIERSQTLSYLLPIATEGSGSIEHDYTKTACVLHRIDGSVDAIDIFSRQNSAFNTIITGKTGSGKSVFGNTLSRALLSDKQIQMIKIDVGGSYLDECREYEGEYVKFDLQHESGIDPFQRIDGDLTKEELSVLSQFVGTLGKEESDANLKKGEKNEIEEKIESFFKSSLKRKSFHRFLEEFPELSRAKTLKRFGESGIFSNAISARAKKIELNRYTYFNFEGLLGASDPDYASAVMAAVIAEVNLKIIKASKKDARELGQRLILFCDETKFFMQRNGEFFLLTTANFRKFGHAVILLGQNIEDFKLNLSGRPDLGLILNSPNRIFFKANCDPEFLRKNLSLSESAIDQITGSQANELDFREFVSQSDQGIRTMRLYLTPSEYWATTTRREEVDLKSKLKTLLPEINDEAIISLILNSKVIKDQLRSGVTAKP